MPSKVIHQSTDGRARINGRIDKLAIDQYAAIYIHGHTHSFDLCESTYIFAKAFQKPKVNSPNEMTKSLKGVRRQRIDVRITVKLCQSLAWVET